jgi:DNA helicase-4
MKANCIPAPENILPQNCILPNDIRDKFIIENIISPFFIKYQTELAKRGELDFTDAILKARDICNDGHRPRYDYILVDEFQDISMDRYEFLKSLRTLHPLTKLFCVGDDWQSIYRFAGSNMALFKDFSKYFGYTKECRMETTFRFGEPAVSMSSDFILKNPEQKEKSVKPYDNRLKTELKTIYYNSSEDLRKMVAGTLSHLPNNKSIYILGRYSFDVDVLKSNDFEVYMKGDKTFIKHDGREYPYLTAHQSKGLEADYVLLLNCNSGAYGFPSTISDDPVLSRVLSENDHFEFGEERRLFYVAITRGKRMTYIFYDKKHPSTFVTEIEPDVPLADRCPVCHAGRKTMVHSGVAKNGSKFYTYICSNTAAGCDYRQTVFDSRDKIKKIGF